MKYLYPTADKLLNRQSTNFPTDIERIIHPTKLYGPLRRGFPKLFAQREAEETDFPKTSLKALQQEGDQ